MLNLFKNFDIFQREPRLYLSGHESFPTKYGMVTGIMTILCCVSFISYFITDYFQKTSINIIQNNVFYEQPKFDFDKLPFAFSLQNFQGELLKPSHYYFTLMMFIFKPEDKGKSTLINLKVEKCNIDTHFADYRTLLEKFDLDLYYCVKPGQVDKNMTVYGNFGDLKNGYGYVNLYTSKCRNNSIFNTENVTCSSQDEIDRLLDKAIYLRLGYLDYDVDHNREVPAVPIFKTEAQQVTTKFYPRIYYNMRNDIYRSDNGILGESFEIMSYTTFDKVSNILTMNAFVAVPDAFTLFSLLISPTGLKYTRSFVKIQTLLANIGGVVNAVIIIMKFLSYRISDKIIMAHNINQAFKIAKTENKNNDINSISKAQLISTNLTKIKFNNYFKNAPLSYNTPKDNREINKITDDKNYENTNNQNLGSKEHKVKKLKNGLYSRRKLTLNFKQLLCPMGLVTQNDYFNEFSAKIKKFLSSDYLIKNSIQLQIMKIILLGDSDSLVLSNLPFITPDFYHRIFNFENSKKEENRKKVLEIIQSSESKLSQLINDNL